MTAPRAATMAPADAVASRVVFDAILYPHRSLGRSGFATLMTAAAAVGLAVGGGFALSGAWPVLGLYVLDLALLYWAFRINYLGARRYEKVWLTPDRLVVERGGPSGPQGTWSFQPYWLRVAIDDPPDHDSQLTLSSHGRSLVVGSFLSPGERLDFANALRAALQRANGTVGIARIGLARVADGG